VAGSSVVFIGEVELFKGQDTGGVQAQVTFSPSGIVFNAGAIGALARGTKRVVVDTGDVGVEHSLLIDVGRGPVTIRVGSTDGDDDYVAEATLGTGYHNLSFTPAGDFYIRLQSDAIVDRVVRSIAIGDSG